MRACLPYPVPAYKLQRDRQNDGTCTMMYNCTICLRYYDFHSLFALARNGFSFSHGLPQAHSTVQPSVVKLLKHQQVISLKAAIELW